MDEFVRVVEVDGILSSNLRNGVTKGLRKNFL